LTCVSEAYLQQAVQQQVSGEQLHARVFEQQLSRQQLALVHERQAGVDSLGQQQLRRLAPAAVAQDVQAAVLEDGPGVDAFQVDEVAGEGDLLALGQMSLAVNQLVLF
jgi:hypothetical protein